MREREREEVGGLESEGEREGGGGEEKEGGGREGEASGWEREGG